MINIFRSLKRRLVNFNYRRNYYLSRFFPRSVPATVLRYLPHGFTVHVIANTGLRIVENFCTREEADYLIKKSREYPSKNKTLANTHAVNDVGNTFFSTNVFDRLHQDSRVLPIIARGAMLAGVPVDHVEAAIVSQLRDGTLYHGYHDFAEDLPTADCLCTMLIYLNDLKPEQGGATYFKDLNTAVQPMTGRAVIWSNMNPDGTMHMKIKPGTLPPRGEASEKWVMQLWIRTYPVHPILEGLPSIQVSTGIPLSNQDALPPRTWFASSSN